MHVSPRLSWRTFSCATARPALLIAAAAAVLSAAGCAHAGQHTASADAAVGGIGAAPTMDPTAPVQIVQTTPGYAGGTTGTNTTRHDPHPSTSASPSTSTPAAPVIAYFKIQQLPKCKGSSGQGPIIPLIVEWKVTGADTVTLSTDGTTKSYPASGTETYVFGCAGAPGSSDSHTYTLTAVHDGTHATKSLTASAVVN